MFLLFLQCKPLLRLAVLPSYRSFAFLYHCSPLNHLQDTRPSRFILNVDIARSFLDSLDMCEVAEPCDCIEWMDHVHVIH